MNPTLKTIKEYAEALVIALLLALFIRTFIVQAFKIPSGSMLETLQIGDHLLVNKFSYGVKIPFLDKVIVPVSDPGHGDIIVFEFPRDPSKDFIKRIIGLPGDTLEMRDKVVYRNGERLDEPYVRPTSGHMVPARDNFGPVTVPGDSYFVLGDNRDNSEDSRFWGYVKREKIKGKAFIIYWSWKLPHAWPFKGLTDATIRWSRIGRLVE